MADKRIKKAMRLRVLVACTLALSALASAAAPSGAGSRYRETTTELMPGVTYTAIRDPKGPYRIKMVTVDPTSEATIDVALATDELPGFETTSSMATRHGAIAAINGDYARASGRPVMTFAEDGYLAQTPLVWGRNFAIRSDESLSYIGHPEVTAWAREVDSGLEHPLTTANAGPPAFEEMALFTPDGSYEERPPSEACSARMYPTDDPHARPDGLAGVEQTFVVDLVRCRSRRVWPKGGNVVSAPLGGTYDPVVRALVPGEQVVVGWSLGWPAVLDTLGGNPTLIEAGQIVPGNVDGTGSFFRRHPRTGVGTTPDGRILLVTVDGRQPDRSVGMTLRRFAEFFLGRGADYALNLDGGGSTTMVTNGEVRNRPSDGPERAVSSALLVLPGPDYGEVQATGDALPFDPSTWQATGDALPFDPASSWQAIVTDPASTWQAIVTDPASTGGLAAWLLESGLELPPSLARAARTFNQR